MTANFFSFGSKLTRICTRDSVIIHLMNVHDSKAFKGLMARDMSATEMRSCEDRLRVLSGVYGLIRPRDLIRPYRLEMGTKMDGVFAKKGINVSKAEKGRKADEMDFATMKTLYEYWGGDIATLLQNDINYFYKQRVKASKKKSNVEKVLVNCASQEYWKAVHAHEEKLLSEGIRIVDIHFASPATVYVKEARGAMARFIIVNEIDSVDELKQFTGNSGEWKFDEKGSNANVLSFTRNAANNSNSSKKNSNSMKSKNKRDSSTIGEEQTLKRTRVTAAKNGKKK